MINRRTLLAGATVAAVETQPRKAQIAITLDLEMSRNFPRWEDTHWDFEKGNLNEATRRYAVEAGRRVKRAGGLVHYFLVARALEQERVEWLHELRMAAGRSRHGGLQLHMDRMAPGNEQFLHAGRNDICLLPFALNPQHVTLNHD